MRMRVIGVLLLLTSLSLCAAAPLDPLSHKPEFVNEDTEEDTVDKENLHYHDTNTFDQYTKRRGKLQFSFGDVGSVTTHIGTMITNNQASIPTEGVWSGWSEFGSCSATCGAATKKRERTCNGGAQCPGSKEDIVDCTLSDCGGVWSDWSEFGPCSATKKRERTCSGGTKCPGSNEEIVECTLLDCGTTTAPTVSPTTMSSTTAAATTMSSTTAANTMSSTTAATTMSSTTAATTMAVTTTQDCYDYDIEYRGTALNSGTQTKLESALECQNLCQQTNGCIRFTWIKKPLPTGTIFSGREGECWLKDTTTNTKPSHDTTGLISGPAVCICEADKKIDGGACMCDGKSCDIGATCTAGKICTPAIQGFRDTTIEFLPHLPEVEYWGIWGNMESCTYPHFANEMELRIESKSAVDDTALNAIRLTCADGKKIKSLAQQWGDWRGAISCPEGSYIKKARFRRESGGSDATAGNGVRFICSDGSEHHPGDGHWGEWSEWRSCGVKSVVYGIQTRVEADSSDDTALNDVKFLCGKLPEDRMYIETPRITFPDDGEDYWGDWGDVKRCQFPHFANKMRLKIEEEQGDWTDDTALNAIALTCTDGTEITSSEGQWGDWGKVKECPEGTYIKKVMMRRESGGTDATAGNGIRFECTDRSERQPGDGHWGDWSKWNSCEDGSAVYGIQTRVEKEGGDDTALNDVRFFCASTKPRATGEEVCEGHGYEEEDCAAKGCCHFRDGQCLSSVGQQPCQTKSNIGLKGKGGEGVCEGHDYKEAECIAKGCCNFYDGECWSSVGQQPCRSNTNFDETLKCEGKKGCCTEENSCEENDGHCSKDSECEGNLECGTENCAWGNGDNCCKDTGLYKGRFTRSSRRILRTYNLENKRLVRDKTVEPSTETIEWGQILLCTWGCSKDFLLVDYYEEGDKINNPVMKVYVAKDELSPPDEFRTSGYRGFLNFGFLDFGDKDQAIFFVLLPKEWHPFQKRFKTNSFTKFFDDGIAYAGATGVTAAVQVAATAKVGAVMGSIVPGAGNLIGGMIGGAAGFAVYTISPTIFGDYLRHIG